MATKSNIAYANTYFGVETLQTRHMDSLDFYDVGVTCARALAEEIASDVESSLTDEQIDQLIWNNLWDKEDGEARAQNLDRLDFHTVSIWSISAFINSTLDFSRFVKTLS